MCRAGGGYAHMWYLRKQTEACSFEDTCTHTYIFGFVDSVSVQLLFVCAGAVVEAFKRLHAKGLIYRGTHYRHNPFCTSISESPYLFSDLGIVSEGV